MSGGWISINSRSCYGISSRSIGSSGCSDSDIYDNEVVSLLVTTALVLALVVLLVVGAVVGIRSCSNSVVYMFSSIVAVIMYTFILSTKVVEFSPRTRPSPADRSVCVSAFSFAVGDMLDLTSQERQLLLDCRSDRITIHCLRFQRSSTSHHMCTMCTTTIQVC